MSEWLVRGDEGQEREVDSRSEAEEVKQDMESLGVSVEIIPPNEDNVLDSSEGYPGTSAEATDGGTEAEVIEADTSPSEVVEATQSKPEQLSKDPIGFLRSVNGDFVNTIKGKPAISKQGFRFIQREFEISTESEVVEWSDDPMGCVVWAKAELPSGYSAEAHGEGYQFEPDVSDNEFVRYADTRAKNRAISDLTSAGALAVSELQE
jgi:hypothetical protein